MNKFSFILFFFTGFIFSQNSAEVKTITINYNKDSIANYIQSFTDQNYRRIQRLEEFKFNNPGYEFKRIKKDKILELYDVIDGEYFFAETMNTGSAITIKSNTLYNGGSLGLNIQGQNMNVGVWDAGSALSTHNEFPNNKIVVSDASTPDDHATHVSGTIGAKGIQANLRGIAFDSTILSFDWTNDLTEMLSAATNSGLLVSNHSYTISSALSKWLFGAYDTRARSFDQTCFQAFNYLPVLAAGNDRNDFQDTVLGPYLNEKGGYNLIRGMANAKNVLTVGAVTQVNNNTNPANIVMSGFSSWGPTDDGRIKPDLVAKGVQVRSTLSSSNTASGFQDGTSMAAPAVSGGLILLQQYHNSLFNNYMRAATLKGLALHTTNEAGFFRGPDYMFGWGLLNVEKAAILIRNKSQNIEIISENTLSNNTSYTLNVVATGTSPLIASISWTDRAGIANNTNAIDPLNSNLINDLDLRVFKDGVEYFPWTLDPANPGDPAIRTTDNFRDNFEKIEIDTPVVGNYQIVVSHKGSLTGSSQNFSLIVSGVNQTLSTTNFNVNLINIYPNPTSNILFVNTSDVTVSQYEVYDLQGRLVKSAKVNDLKSFDIDLNDIFSGMYLVQIYSNNGVSSHKIIKNN
jgi:hypothetical protein